MLEKITWYFRISAEAGICKGEDGENAPAYMTYSLSFKVPIDESKITNTYEEQAEAVKEEAARQMHIPVKWLEIISEQEYMENTEAED